MVEGILKERKVWVWGADGVPGSVPVQRDRVLVHHLEQHLGGGGGGGGGGYEGVLCGGVNLCYIDVHVCGDYSADTAPVLVLRCDDIIRYMYVRLQFQQRYMYIYKCIEMCTNQHIHHVSTCKYGCTFNSVQRSVC